MVLNLGSLENLGLSTPFPSHALTAEAIFLRSYSRRKPDSSKESWLEAIIRETDGMIQLGQLDLEESALIRQMAEKVISLPSGRWFWVGGTEWVQKPENFFGAYNCSSSDIIDWESFGNLMSLAMMGCGTGAVLLPECLAQLPTIVNKIQIIIEDNPGDSWNKGYPPSGNQTALLSGSDRRDYLPKDLWDTFQDGHLYLSLGDSRQGWVDAYVYLLGLASNPWLNGSVAIPVHVFLGEVRPKGEVLKGFGGLANPEGLSRMLSRVGEILSGAQGRQLNTIESCLLIDEAALAVVAGNIRRSAGIRQGASEDALFASAKQNLWVQTPEGKWTIDPQRDALRMANHTRVFMHRPTFEECLQSIRDQFTSGEGAIQYAPIAISRASADILDSQEKITSFLEVFQIADPALRTKQAKALLIQFDDAKVLGNEWETLKFKSWIECVEAEVDDRLKRFGLNPCFDSGTMILTRQGHFPIESLVGKVVEVWDGYQWVEIDNFRITGENQDVYAITLCSGQVITATAYHTFILDDGRKIELRNLKPGNHLATHDVQTHGIHHEFGAYLKGFLSGDGTIRNGLAALDLYDTKYCCIDRLIESANELAESLVGAKSRSSRERSRTDIGFNDPAYGRRQITGLAALDRSLRDWCSNRREKFPLEILNWDLPSKLEFIAGYMDADGSSSDTRNGFMYQSTSIYGGWLVGFQMLLRTVGVKSRLGLNKEGGKKDFGERGGICDVQPLHRLTISQKSSIVLAKQVIFARLKSFADRTTVYRLKSKETKIASIKFSHVADRVYCCTVPTNHSLALTNGVLSGQCGEIIMRNNLCDLSEIHLNQIDPNDFQTQIDAFRAGALNTCPLLRHEFPIERYQRSRTWDPIVGVSITGLFDFFVSAFGVRWLEWWQAGRTDGWGSRTFESGEAEVFWFSQFDPTVGREELPQVEAFACLAEYFTAREQDYLSWWKSIVESSVADYCDRHGIRKPNRCTTVQPAGSKSLLTGASPGWHPPKAKRYIRRMTFSAHDPLALSHLDMGFTIVPGQKDKDENGMLLDDPFDPRCTEWLVEFPIEIPWAKLPGAEAIEIEEFSALAQLDFWMQVQTYYAGHNVSATCELTEAEIPGVAAWLYGAIQTGKPYISTTFLARLNAPFPRLPFEKIDRATYEKLRDERLERWKANGSPAILDRLAAHDQGVETGPMDPACSSQLCEMMAIEL